MSDSSSARGKEFRSPVRGSVFLLNTEGNEARKALEEHLSTAVQKYNENFSRADVRLIPAGIHDRDKEYYIFPFLFHALHSVGFFEEFIRSQLSEALSGRAVQIRCVRDHSTGESRHYIDIATRKPKTQAEESTGNSLCGFKMFIFVIVLGVAALIAAHRARLQAHPD